MSRVWAAVLILAAGLLLIEKATTLPQQEGSQSPAVRRSSGAAALTADGARLLVVNPDSNSISLLDTAALTLTAEIPVGLDPRTVTVNDAGDRAYVANRGGNTVSVVDLNAGQVVAEIQTGSRPYGVLVNPEGTQLYVSEQGADRLRIVDTLSLSTIALIPIADRPTGLALSDDGRSLYITHFLTNHITRFDASFPYIIHLPLVHHDSPAAGAATTAVATRSSIAIIPLWPDSNLVNSIVIAPDGRTAYIPHTRSNSSQPALTFDTTVFPLISLVDLETQQHLIGQQFDLGTLDPPGIGLPFDAALTADGQELWVLNAASNDITVLGLESRRRLAHIEVGDNPRGIVLSPDGATAYVVNTLAGTVSLLDTAAYTVTTTIATTQIPLPPLLLRGKRLFNSSDDPRLSKAQWIACSTCHFDGEQDGRTWFFAFAGPRNTTSLLGMVQTYPLRWSGEWNESADSEFAIRKENFGSGLFSGEMNCSISPPDCVNQLPHQGRAEELDALAAFIDSLPLPLSIPPGQQLAAVQRGQSLFNEPALGCVTCHPAPLYTDHLSHDVGTSSADERIGPNYDTPSLRALYDSPPYFHDGSATTLYDALTRPSPGGEHDVSSLLSPVEIQELISFLQALPFE